jgi:hypothetical protein
VVGAKSCLADRKRAPEAGFGGRVLAPILEDQAEMVEAFGRVGVVGAGRPLAERQRAPKGLSGN